MGVDVGVDVDVDVGVDVGVDVDVDVGVDVDVDVGVDVPVLTPCGRVFLNGALRGGALSPKDLKEFEFEFEFDFKDFDFKDKAITMRIKICGITRHEDARIAADLGVDALGFIFAPESPRYIAPADAAEIIKRLPPFVSKVGVFVNENPQDAFDAAVTAGVDTVQFHGDETPERCAHFPLPVIKVFSVGNDFDPAVMSRYKVSGYLLDTWDRERRGGSGRTFDWSIAAKICGKHNAVILSGGLGTLNIREAVEAVHPYAVDINSGAEISPGVKNPYKIKEIVSIVRGVRKG